MLQSVEIKTVLALAASPFHNLHWQHKLEMSLDCFICERTGRTTLLTVGAARAVCSGGGEVGKHYAPARIAAFDHTDGPEHTTLRLVVDYWWAPFHDAKRDEPAGILARPSWVRHYLGYRCPHQEKSGDFCVQTNHVRPVPLSCQHCSVLLCESREVPRVRVLADRA